MNDESLGTVHHPFYFHLGNMAMSGYGIAIVMAFAIAWVTIARENATSGEDPAFAGEIVLAASIGGLVGAKLFYVGFLGGGPILSRGGHSFWGGLIGGACSYWLWTRLRGVSFLRYLDITGIGISAGYAVGRTGCWAIGDDYGRPWNSIFAVKFPEGSPPSTADNMLRIYGVTPPHGGAGNTIIAVHPTQLYETALGFVMFLILWRLRDTRRARGWLFGLYCILAGVERFLVEFVRVGPARRFLGLSLAQLVALTITIIGGLLIYARRDATYLASKVEA
jgi:phosphatidylglycerol---prolipoprotein diacylglyceryl transferase